MSKTTDSKDGDTRGPERPQGFLRPIRLLSKPQAIRWVVTCHVRLSM